MDYGLGLKSVNSRQNGEDLYFAYVENSYCKIEAIKIPPAKVINETRKKIAKEIGYDIDRWCVCI